MDPLDRQMLRETLELARENNEYLKKMRRTMLMGSVMKFVYWIVILGAAVGAFYFVKPYIDLIQGLGGGIGNAAGNVKSLLEQIN